MRAKTQRVQHPVEMPFGAAATLDGETGGLIQHDHRVVAMQDRVPQHGFVAGRHLSQYLRRRGRHLVERRNADCLTRCHPVARAGALTVDPDVSRAQQPFEAAVAECGIVPLEPAVETNRTVFAANRHGVGGGHSPTPALRTLKMSTDLVRKRGDGFTIAGIDAPIERKVIAKFTRQHMNMEMLDRLLGPFPVRLHQIETVRR